MLVQLNITPSDEMKEEGIAREVVNKIQECKLLVSHDQIIFSGYIAMA